MIREFTVTPVLNGYVVRVGCQLLVFESRKNLVATIDSYLQAPEVMEKAIVEDSINAKHMPGLGGPQQIQPTEYPTPPVSVYGHTMPCNPVPPMTGVCRDQEAEGGPRY
jgi:hypothetical protein